jgi:release factor glutamine methyltransferase
MTIVRASFGDKIIQNAPEDKRVLGCPACISAFATASEKIISPRMTVLEAIQKSAEFLGKKGVESPRLQAELLLAHLLKVPRMKLYLNFERALSPAETDALRQLVKRRGAREPLQHIVGTTSFCGYEMAVNRHALVPRPETELLAQEGWKFLQERAAAGRSPTVLDFGTGTGCLAIALAIGLNLCSATASQRCRKVGCLI